MWYDYEPLMAYGCVRSRTPYKVGTKWEQISMDLKYGKTIRLILIYRYLNLIHILQQPQNTGLGKCFTQREYHFCWYCWFLLVQVPFLPWCYVWRWLFLHGLQGNVSILRYRVAQNSAVVKHMIVYSWVILNHIMDSN